MIMTGRRQIFSRDTYKLFERDFERGYISVFFVKIHLPVYLICTYLHLKCIFGKKENTNIAFYVLGVNQQGIRVQVEEEKTQVKTAKLWTQTLVNLDKHSLSKITHSEFGVNLQGILQSQNISRLKCLFLYFHV